MKTSKISLLTALIVIIIMMSILSCQPKLPELKVIQGSNEINPDSNYYLGAVRINTMGNPLEFTLKNAGNLDLNINRIFIEGEESNQFQLEDLDTPISIEPNGDISMDIGFNPTSTGTKQATVSIESDDPDNPTFSFIVAGIGSTSNINIRKGTLNIPNGGSYDCGYLLINNSKDIDIMIENLGDDDLTITDISLGDDPENSFSINDISIPPSGLIIDGSDSESFTLRFSPTIEGNKNNTLTITSDDPNIPNYVITVIGVGTISEIYLKQGSDDIDNDPLQGYDFGNIVVGESSTEVTFIVGNSGTGNLIIDDVYLTGTDAGEFTVDISNLRQESYIIPAGSEKSFMVQFNPTSIGNKTAVVNIDSNTNGTSSTFQFLVSGIGSLSQINVIEDETTINHQQANPYEFRDVQVGGSGDPVSFTIENTGNGVLTITDISITGDNPSNFILNQDNFLPNVAPSESTEFDITFNPDSEGNFNAIVTIESNADNYPTFEYDISGRGDDETPPPINLQPYDKGHGITLNWTEPSYGIGINDYDKTVILVYEDSIENPSLQRTVLAEDGISDYSYHYVYEELNIGSEYDFTLETYDEAGNKSDTDVYVNVKYHIHDYILSLGNDYGVFASPNAITVDSSNNIYMTDVFLNNVQKFDINGQLLSTWGSLGSGDGQFNSPQGISANTDGSLVLVADTLNDRIQVFDTNGIFQYTIGSSGYGDGELDNPMDIHVVDEGGSDYIYVVDSGNHRVQKFDISGNHQSQFGSYGTGNGEFDNPVGIVIDPMDNIYVLEMNNYRVQMFNSSYVYQSQFGSFGNGSGLFKEPYDITLVDSASDPNGYLIYVLDATKNKLVTFNSDGTSAGDYGSSGGGGAGRFRSPRGFAFANDGSSDIVIVTDNINRRVQRFYPDSSTFDIFMTNGSTDDGEFNNAQGLAVSQDGNIIYVSDHNNHNIQRFDWNDINSEYEFTLKWGVNGTGNGEFVEPSGVALDSLGNVYVCDRNNYRIQKFDSDGNYILQWGSQGTGDDQFKSPFDIEVNTNNDKVYVIDKDVNNVSFVKRFDSNGNFELKWGSPGTDEGDFSRPEGITIDGDGNVYISDLNNKNIQKFDSNGNFLLRFGEAARLNGVLGIAIDKHNNVYITSSENYYVVKYDSNGNFITTFGELGFGNDALFYHINDIEVDNDANVYLIDNMNGTVLKFTE
jgi:DNA-binding beta-propeller fold protein YncE